MSDRFPLILNTSTNQIQEIASGDTLDLTGNNIKGVGIITATSFIGNITGGVTGDATGLTGTPDIDVRNITGAGATFSGSLIFNGNVTANADLDVDGHTNLDNVNVGGATTTSGVVVINAVTQSTNSTSGALRVAGGAGIVKNVNVGGDLDVDGHTNLDNVSIAGVTTAAGTLRVGTGHTFHDNGNAQIAGIATFHNQLNIPRYYGSGTPTGQYLSIGTDEVVMYQRWNGSVSNIEFRNHSAFFGHTSSASGKTLTIQSGAITRFKSIQSNGGSATYAEFNKAGTGGYVQLYGIGVGNKVLTTDANGVNILKDIDVDGHTNLDNVSVAGVSTFTGNADFSSGIDVTGNGVFSGNVSVGGVLTYEDVTNVDSVGIVTARTGLKVLAGGANVAGVVTATGGVFVPDNNQIQLGNVAGSADLRIYHQSSNNHSYISETGSGSLVVLADDFYVQDTSTNTMISAKEGAEVNLHFNGGTPKLSTTNTGISVSGRADISGQLAVGTSGVQSSNVVSIKGAVSNQLNIADSSNSGWGLLLTQSQASGGYHSTTNSGVGKPCAIVNVNSDALNFGTNNTMRWTIDHLGHFYPGGNGHLDIGKSGSQVKTIFSTGAVVSGVVTATSFSGDGSNLTGVLVGISTEQVTPSSNVATLNLAKDDHKIVASGTYTIDVSGGTEAGTHTLRIENSGTANVGFSTYFKFPSGGTPSLPTASGAISLISFSVHKVGSVGIATVLLAGASVNFS